MSDSTRELLEQMQRAADPYGDLGRLTDPIGEAHRQLEIGLPATEFLRQEEERQRLLSGLAGDFSFSATAFEEATSHLQQIQGPFKEAARLGLFDPNSDICRSMQEAQEAARAFEEMFRRPEYSEIESLAKEALASVVSHDTHFSSSLHLSELQTAIEAMRSSWVSIDDPGDSIRAFSEIHAIGQMLDEWSPFEEACSASLRRSLGDWREPFAVGSDLFLNPFARIDFYVDRGFDRRLTDFTISAFEECIGSAGLREEGHEQEGPCEDEEDGNSRACVAYAELRRFELVLRTFIEEAMLSTFGERWMERQLPNGMLDKWLGKRAIALKTGESEHRLIDYADFSDYRQIIERKDNWRAIFSSIFGRADDIRESLQRLHPVRIATMHSRIVTQEDKMLLVVETKRVLRAIQRSSY